MTRHMTMGHKLRVTEIRYDSAGKAFLALQGQTDEEAQEMNRQDLEMRDKAWAAALARKFECPAA